MREVMAEVFTVVTLTRWVRICSLDQRMQEFQVCVLSDSMGWMNARVAARWRSEERRMRYLL